MAFKDIAAYFGLNFRSDVSTDKDGRIRVNADGNIVVRHAGADRVFIPSVVAASSSNKNAPAGINIIIDGTSSLVKIKAGLRGADDHIGDFTFDLSADITIDPTAGDGVNEMGDGQTFTTDTSYAIYLEGDSTDTLPVVAFLADVSTVPNPAFHTGYNRRLRIGWCKRGVLEPTLFKQTQVGNLVIFTDAAEDIGLTTTSTAAGFFAALNFYGMPPNTTICKMLFKNVVPNSLSYGRIADAGDTTGGVVFSQTAVANDVHIIDLPCEQVDASNHKMMIRSAAAGNVSFLPLGYYDTFGKG